MVHYKFRYKNFPDRFISHAKIFIFIMIFAFFVSSILSGNILYSFVLASIFMVVILLPVFKSNIYFISDLDIKQDSIFIKWSKNSFDEINRVLNG
jgi:hypothetical protein